MSYKTEVETYDEPGKFNSNGLFFATEQEAVDWGQDLWGRWTQVRATRAAKSEEPVNYRFTTGRLVEVER